MISKSKRNQDVEILHIKEDNILTVNFLVGNKIYEHQILQTDDYIGPFTSKSVKKGNTPSTNELKNIVLGGVK